MKRTPLRTLSRAILCLLACQISGRVQAEANSDRVEAHVRKEGFAIVRHNPDLETRRAHRRVARIERRPGYRAVRTSLDHPAVPRVIEAVRRATGEDPLLVPTLGGSLPLYLFIEKLEAPVAILPIANHDDNQHAPNENLRLGNLWYGIDVMAALLTAKPSDTGSAGSAGSAGSE